MKYIFLKTVFFLIFTANLLAQDSIQTISKPPQLEKELNELTTYDEKIKLLFKNGALHYYSNNLDESETNYNKILTLAQLKKDTINIAKSLFKLGFIATDKGGMDEATRYSQRIETLLENKTSDFDYLYLGKAKCIMSKVFIRSEQKAKALENSLIENQLYKKVKNIKEVESGLTYNYNTIAYIYSFSNNYEEAIENINTSLELSTKTKNNKQKVRSYLIIGEVYSKLEEYDKALDYYSKALKISQEEKNISLISHTLTHMGDINYAKKKYKKAIASYNKALFYSKKGDHKSAATINSYTNLGISHAEFDKKLALKYIDSALVLSKGLDFITIRSAALIAKSEIHKTQKKYDLALKVLNENLNYLEPTKSSELIMTVYDKLYLLYSDIGDIKKSLFYYKKYITIKGELEQASKETSLEILEVGFKFRESNAKLEKKKIELELTKVKKKRLEANICFAIILMCLIFSFLIFIIYRKRKLAKTKALVSKAKQELLKFKGEYLDREVEFKNKSITDFALQINEKNALLRKIKTQLKDIRPANNESKSTLLNAVLFINNDIKKNEEKIELYVSNEKTNDDFESKINENFKNLTSKEIKVAIMIRLGKTSKEISQELNISTGSVDNYRYSMRKKMKTSLDKSLKTFINDI